MKISSIHSNRIIDLLQAEHLVLGELQELVFQSCPDPLRGSCWKLLLEYLPLNRCERSDHVRQRRLDYRQYVQDLAGDVHTCCKSRASVAEGGVVEDVVELQSSVSSGISPPGSLHTSNLFGSPSKVGTISASKTELDSLLASLGDDVARSSEDDEEEQCNNPPTLPPLLESPCVTLDENGGGESPLLVPFSESAIRETKEVELRREIEKDVERTHCELAFFCNPAHTSAMFRILLVYAKLNKGVLYIQGMNELLAPLLYVCVTDKGAGLVGSTAEDDLDGVDGSGPSLDEAEADAFFLFCALMAVHRDVFMSSQDNSSSGIRGQLARLGRALHRREPTLAAHLDTLGISPQFYALRWLTTLCTRELSFPDTMMMWDRLLSDPRGYFLLPFCVAMLRVQRATLLKSSFGDAMKILQRSTVFDFLALIQTALEVREEELVERAAVAAATTAAHSISPTAQQHPPPPPHGGGAENFIAGFFNSSSSSGSPPTLQQPRALLGGGLGRLRPGKFFGAPPSRESSWSSPHLRDLSRENSWVIPPAHSKLGSSMSPGSSEGISPAEGVEMPPPVSRGEGGPGAWFTSLTSWSLFRGPSPPPPPTGEK